jgi:hypothetical protein
MNPKFMRWSVIVGVVAAIVVQSFIKKSNRSRVRPGSADEYGEFLGI